MLGKKVNILVLTLLTLLSATSFADTQYSATVCDGSKYLFGCTPITPTQGSGTYDNGTQHVRLTFGSPIGKQYTATIVPGEKYIFGCEVLTSDVPTSIEKIKTLPQAGCECDSTVKLTLLVQAPVVLTDTTVKYSATIEQGETYLFGCDTLTKDTLIFKTLQRANGADSIIYLQLTVNAPVPPAADTTVKYSATIEQGETYLFGCDTLAKDTLIFKTLQRANGADSIIYLQLTVNAPVPPVADTTVKYSATIEQGETYLFGCDTLTKDTLIFKTLQRANGADSIIYLQLTVNAPVPPAADTTVKYNATIEQGETYLFGCDTLTKDTLIFKTLQRANGADSIIYLQLTVEPACPATPVVGDTTAIICEGDLPFLWHGMSLSSDTTMCDDTLRAVIDNKCDSIVRLTLIIKATSTFEDYASICPSELPYTWHGITFNEAKDSIFTLTNAVGCDSVVTLHLTLKATSAFEDYASICPSELPYTWHGITFDEAKDSIFTLTNAVGCDSVVTLHLTVLKPDTTVLPAVDSCNRYHLKTADIDTLITTTDNYKFVFQNANGCDSVVTINVTIATPYVDTLSLIHKFGDRLLMINRKEINAIPGWYLDSLDTDHPEYVSWYEIDPAGNEKPLHDGYTHSLPNGEPLPAGYTYYAEVNIPAVGGNCGAIGTTKHYTIPSAAPAPALMPSLARPGEEIRIVNLDPGTQTTVRIYSADGIMHGRYTVHGVESYTIKAAGTTGFYMVELTNESLQSTLRYIVK